MPTIYIKTTLNPNDNQYHLHSMHSFVTERKFVGMRDKQLSKEQLSLALTDEDALTPQFFCRDLAGFDSSESTWCLVDQPQRAIAPWIHL